MPIYDYVCHHCGHRFEVIHGVHAAGPVTCPSCGGGPVRKAIAAPTIHFKGTGWAKKDRGASARRASRDDDGKAAPAAAASTDSSGTTGSGESPKAAGTPSSSDGGGTSTTKPASSNTAAD